jgi:hypothetical protein
MDRPPCGNNPYVRPMRIITRPTAKIRFPHHSILAAARTATSFSFRYAHTMPNTPIGTLIQNTARQTTSASTPPTTNPINEAAMPAMTATPIAKPRRLAGNASVMMAAEFAVRSAPPTPCTMRHTINHIAPLPPVYGHNDSASEAALNTAKPALYMRTRPKMSPRRPNVTTRNGGDDEVANQHPQQVTDVARLQRIELDATEDGGKGDQHDRGVEGGHEDAESCSRGRSTCSAL